MIVRFSSARTAQSATSRIGTVSIHAKADATPRTPPKDHSDKICNACGERGHIACRCKKLKEHAAETKTAIGYTGEPKWLMDEGNCKKCIVLLKTKQWFAVAVHNPDQKPGAPEDAITGGAEKQCKLPFTVERNLIDAGWMGTR